MMISFLQGFQHIPSLSTSVAGEVSQNWFA